MRSKVLGGKFLGVLLGSAGALMASAQEADWIQPVDCSELSCTEEVPQTTIKLGTVFLDRGTGDNVSLFEPLIGTSPGYGTGDLDLGVGSGFQLELSRRLNDGLIFSTSYMGIDSYGAGLSASGLPTTLIGQGFNGFPPVLTGAEQFSAYYSSELHTVDLNLGRSLNDRVTLSAGVRYFYLSEEFGLETENYPLIIAPTGDETTQNSTYNNLFGVQAKADINLWKNDYVSIDTTGFAGIYANHATATATGARDGSFMGLADFEGTSRDSTTKTAFLGGLNLSATNHLTDYAYIQVGYQLMWLSGVALAPEQLDNTNIPLGTGTVDASGNVSYRGGFINLVLTR